MCLSLFLEGCVIGFSIAMPVGPIALLCIRNTLTLGFFGGLCSGLGAAIADAAFGVLAGLGVATLTTLLTTYHLWIHLVGALILILLGAFIVKNAEKTASKHSHENIQSTKNLIYAFFSTMLLTFVNPLTILSYAAVYAAVSNDIVQITSLSSALMIAAGVFIGATAWWTILSALTNSIKHKLDATYMARINTISGLFLIALGICTGIAGMVETYTHS